jgi:alpha-L-fucosidase
MIASVCSCIGVCTPWARHEWLTNLERIETEAYERYARYFDPDLFDPVDWVRQAKRAGMKYIVLTTKHHDGL